MVPGNVEYDFACPIGISGVILRNSPVRRERRAIVRGDIAVPTTAFPYRVPALPAARRVLTAALLVALAPSTAGAATIIVTSPDDTTTAAIDTCTLRQAIMSIDVGGLVGACHRNGDAFGVDDTITFAASAISGATTPGTVMLADSADPNGGIGGTLVVSAARLTIDGSAWRGSGSGQYADGVTIARPSGATHRFGIIRDTAPAGSLLVLKGLAIRNGWALGGGGGVGLDAADLTISDSRVSGNLANNGSGIWLSSGALTLTRCLIDGNLGGEYGGGVFSGSGNATVTSSTIVGNGEWNLTGGGGINVRGTLTLVDSTISGNGGKRGAGIQVGSALNGGGTLTMIRSTVAGNAAYYQGGGLHVIAGATATLTGSTIAGNSARYHSGGVYLEGTLTATNSTIASNANGFALLNDGVLHLDHATVAQNGNDITHGWLPGGTLPWNGSATIDHSIVSTDIDLGGTWSGSGNLIADPNAALGPLLDNGGATQTMLPGAGSAALDAIAPQDCTQAVDQRGVARPQGAGCDIGAVEVFDDLIFANGFDAPPALRATD